ncbi:unnamed protein product [Periconia digitata]|uniref:Tyrosinase copper-binding domain-containing protein n=1 Tax=Periconia digitata TaxID=1303443 RepID=A0A9W4UGG0_9PLEO|nr:unnamed protein product [Periconia digitata]
MKASIVAAAALLSSVGAAPPPPHPPPPPPPVLSLRLPTPSQPGPLASGPPQAESQLGTDELADVGLRNLRLFLDAQRVNTKNVGPPGPKDAKKCTLENAAVRREWSALSEKEKKEYIAAVQCLAEKPSKTPSELAPGAKSRYDDFVATHINQTLSIHGTGNFLTWHRYFTWAYEQALRNECGYKGYQPYYNWPKWAEDPRKSPLFDGSDTSISGDGEFIAGRNNTCIPSPDACGISLPPGNGGGCLKSGPFKDFKVNLGPVVPVSANIPPNPQPDGLGYNPRCLSRDISLNASQGWTRDSSVVHLLKENPVYLDFATNMQGNFPEGFLGVHTGGHFTIGADPGGDLFASPGDPAFYFHHAMIDRSYWTWQNLDVENRMFALGGTLTVGNNPPSRNTTLDDVLNLGFVGVPEVQIRDAVDTLAGPFCYVYA